MLNSSGLAAHFQRRTQSGKVQEAVFKTLNTMLMCSVILVTLYPFWYIIVCSFSSIGHIIRSRLILWPDGLHFDAYKQIFRNNMVFNAYSVTLRVTIIGTLVSLALTILGAYVLSRKSLPGHSILTFFAVLTMLFSGGLIPTYLVVNSLGITNTIWALIIPSALSTYNMVIMRNFFIGIPESLYEAAEIDGISYTKYLLFILIPLSLPSIATITLFYAVSYWNNYFNSIIYIRDPDLWPMQTLLRQILMANEYDMLFDDSSRNVPSEMMKDAMIVITAIPIICVYPFLQKYFVKGVLVGSLKG